MASHSGESSLRRWLRETTRRPWLIILILALVIAGAGLLCQILFAPFGPKPPKTPTPTLPPQALPLPGTGTTVPGAYVAWTSPDKAVPPTRLPSDPLAPGNQILGFDCGTYLGSGGDVGIEPNLGYAWSGRH